MSSIKKSNTRKVPPKKIKDNVNSALKTVNKPVDALSKADCSIRSGNPVPPPVAKELLSNFYDLMLCKFDQNETSTKSEEDLNSDTTEARFAKTKSNLKKKPGSTDLPIPCTSDLCSKVRQLVQMNNKVQNFKKKFLEVSPDIVDEKRAIQQKKFKIGNEYSKRNATKKVVSKMDKTQKTAEESGCRYEGTKKVRWSPEKVINQSGKLERLHSPRNFEDCLDDDLSSSPDSFCEGFQPNFQKEKQYDTDYTSCAETDYANSSMNSSTTFIQQSSSARMLVHFRELLNMHILPRSADQLKCSILSDEDIAFLQNLVEADERYHCLKNEDHNLLKEILKSQLKQIEAQERILAETLNKLRHKSESFEDISVGLTVPNKEKAEQPLEMSEKKEPPYEVILRDLLKMPYGYEETSDIPDKRSLKPLKNGSSTENIQQFTINESTEIFASNDLEDKKLHPETVSPFLPKNKPSDYISLNNLEDDLSDLPPSLQLGSDQMQFTEDELKDPSFVGLTPLISYPPSPCESPRYFRRCEKGSVKITESITEPYEDPELVVPSLELDKVDDESISGFLKRTFNWFSARERQAGNKKIPSSQENTKAVSARLEKDSKREILEEQSQTSLSERNESKDIKHFGILNERKESPTNVNDLGDPKVVVDNQLDSQNLAALFGSTTPPKKILETSLDNFRKNLDVLEVNQVAKEIVDCEIIKSTAKLITEAISQTSKIYTREQIQRLSRDQETNTVISSLKNEKYFKVSFEYMLFWENLSTVEVCPVFVAKQRHIAKEFRMKYLPLDELYNAGEFFILNSESLEITIEKTNFQTLHKQPEKLTKLLQPMYKQPVDKSVCTSEDDTNYKFLYPWQISEYPISEDIMIQNVICCLFKTWAVYPELYKQTISNCKALVPSHLMQCSREHKEDNDTVLENKREFDKQIQEIDIVGSSDNSEKNRKKNSIKRRNDYKRQTFKPQMTPKNLLVLSAQFLLFTALVLGLSLFQYKCLDM